MSNDAQPANFDWQQTFFPGVFKPDDHPALVSARNTRAELADASEKLTQENYGRDVRQMLGYGLAAGAGATALYHTLRALRRPRGRDRRNLALTTGAPVIAKEANNKKASTSTIDRVIGENLPTGFAPSVSLPDSAGAQKFPADPHTFRPSWAAVAALTAGGLGAWGGNKLVNYLVKNQKKQNNEADIEDARQAYLNAIRGDSKEAQALDAAYAALQEKAADGEQTSSPIQRLLAGAGSSVTGGLQMAHGAGLLALLGSGLYGGKAVYDWTRARTAGDNLAKAQASRARMKGLPTVWVDPDELARVKQEATAPSNE